MRKTTVFVLACAVILMSGCFETKQDFTLNPDGSGKVVLDAVFPVMNLNMTGAGGNQDSDKQTKNAARDLIEKSSGVEIWKDVSFKRTEDERVSFKGTAYFKDISKLKFHNLGEWKISFGTNDDGDMVLEIKAESKNKRGRKSLPQKLSEEEIAKKIKVERAKYKQQVKPMMAAILPGMKTKMTFHLPGSITAITNLSKDASGAACFNFEGAKMLEVMDKLFEDDEWLSKQMLTNANFFKDGFSSNDKMNEWLFGEKAPIRAVVKGDPKTLFDYKSEVAAAKVNYEKISKSLGIAKPIPVAAAAGGGLKSLKVGGIRIITFSDMERGIRPLNWDVGYTLSLVGELPGSVLSVTEAKVEKAIADNGDDLLPEREWDRKIHHTSLSKDKTTVVFDVRLVLPNENVKGLKELSGTLQYIVAEGSEKVDLGIESFSVGAKGKELGSVIESIKDNQWQEGLKTLHLTIELPRHSIKSTTFYNENGEKLEVSASGTSWSGNTTTLNFSHKGQFPPKGRIVLERYAGQQKYNIPFKIENISLLGRPL